MFLCFMPWYMHYGTWQAYDSFWMIVEHMDNITLSPQNMQAQQPRQIQPRLQSLTGVRHVAEARPPAGAEATSQPSGKKREEERFGEGQRMFLT